MKRLALILALLLIAPLAIAQEEEAAPEAIDMNTVMENADTTVVDEVADTNAVGDVTGTNAMDVVQATNSTEAADAILLGLRDPFWPVGYEPPPPEPEFNEEEAEQARAEREIEKKIQWPALHLKGITRAGRNRYMAIIKGVGLVEADQTVSMRQGDMLYSWLIEKVTAKGVMVTRLEARPYHLPTIGIRTQ